jgi:transcriptional regulator with XRE-family HTH domain
MAFLRANDEPRLLLLVAEFPQMNFTQMHEQVRLIVLRRIQRDAISLSLLARQTGYGQSHLSNFLRCKRQLSLAALDGILQALHLTAADLLPSQDVSHLLQFSGEDSAVPIVSQYAALFEPHILPGPSTGILRLQPGTLEEIQVRSTQSRRAWQRFVAIRVSAEDAKAMEPVLQADSIALLDRHYTAMTRYHPDRKNIYAVRHQAHLLIRYVEALANQLVLRPLNLNTPADVIDIDFDGRLSDIIVGRVALVVNEM